MSTPQTPDIPSHIAGNQATAKEAPEERRIRNWIERDAWDRLSLDGLMVESDPSIDYAPFRTRDRS